MKRLLFAAAATLAATSAALAATPYLFAQSAPDLPGKVDPALVKAGEYTIDPAHTLVSWQVDHFGFNDYIGLFGNITGTMTLNPSNIGQSSFSIMVPVAEVTVASAGLKEHLLRAGKDGAAPDFFGPEPGMAAFTSTSVVQTGANTATIEGMLAMNGQSAPVTLMAEFSGAGTNPFSKKETVGFEATGVLDRTQWGVNYGQGLIGNEVELRISVAFELAAAE